MERRFFLRLARAVDEFVSLSADLGLEDSGFDAGCDRVVGCSVINICVMLAKVPAACPNLRATALSKGSCASDFRVM